MSLSFSLAESAYETAGAVPGDRVVREEQEMRGLSGGERQGSQGKGRSFR
jgi:hypothetical protein